MLIIFGNVLNLSILLQTSFPRPQFISFIPSTNHSLLCHRHLPPSARYSTLYSQRQLHSFAISLRPLRSLDILTTPTQVDRSVTGLVARQQCVGPLHTPLADVAVIALSHDDFVGGATAIGEQPIKGLVDAASGARMSLGEALTNLVFASITSLKVL